VEVGGAEPVVRGDPDHPITRGTVCPRVKRHVQRLRSPARLTTPWRRTGTGWQPLSWDAALDLMGARLQATLRDYGSLAVVGLRGGGSLGISKELICHFWNRLGPITKARGGVCGAAGEEAQLRDFGGCASHDYTDLAHSAAVVLWGKNPVATGRHLVPFIKEARQRGAPVALIEPRHTESSRLADPDLVIRVAPGGDGYLALAVLHRLYAQRALDPAAIARTDNFGAFEAMLRGPAPDVARCASRAGVTLDDVDRLAALYRDHHPVATWVGWGLQRRRHGGRNLRFIDALGLLSGNVGVSGGGVSFASRRRRGLRLETLAPFTGRTIAAPDLARELCQLDDPPARFCYIAAANPVTQHPDSRALRRVLRSLPFVVVADAFFTDTAEAADLVLPTTLMLEEDDVVGSYGHHHVARARQAVTPPAGACSDLWILRQLGVRLGHPADPLLEDPAATVRQLTADWFRDSPATLNDARASGDSAAPSRRNPCQPEIPFADGFPTGTGRARLVDAPPQPVAEEAGFPLVFLTPSSRAWQTSQLPEPAQSDAPVCTVHPDAAAPLGLGDGDPAVVQSPLGRLAVQLLLDPRLHPDACVVHRGGWLRHGRAVNTLVQAAATDLGEGAALYDQRVRLIRCARREARPAPPQATPGHTKV